jgi:hypothetical protein
MYKLQDLYYVRGARLIFSGRLTRKERAAYIFEVIDNALINSNIGLIMHLIQDNEIGVVGIKIYLFVILNLLLLFL